MDNRVSPEHRLVGTYALTGPPSRSSQLKRRRTAVVILAACLVLIAGIVVLAGPGRGKSCVPVAAPSVPPGVTVFSEDMDGDGCKSLAFSEGPILEATIASGDAVPHRFAFGRPDDVVTLGDWDCDDTATPAVYRPGTGEIYHFNDWGPPDQPMMSAQPLRGTFGGRPEIGKDGDGCDELFIRPVEPTGERASTPIVAACSPAIVAAPVKPGSGPGVSGTPMPLTMGRNVPEPRGSEVALLAPKAKKGSPVPAGSPQVAPGVFVAWRFYIGATFELAPVVDKDVVYLGAANGSVCAINAKTGSKVWQFDGGGPPSRPTVAGGTVYGGSADGHVFALDATTGAKRWESSVGPVVSAPAVAEGAVYAGSTDGNLYAIDAATGVRRWTFRTGDAIVSSPAVLGKTTYVASLDNSIYAVDSESASPRWQFRTGGPIYSSPVVSDDTVHVGSNDGTLYGLDARTGAAQPPFLTRAPVRSTPAVAGSTVYFGGDDGFFHAVSPVQGVEGWSRQDLGPVESQPTIVDGVVYFGSNDRNLYALDAASGAERWRYSTGAAVRRSVPVGGGSVFVGSDDGFLHKLVLAPPPADARK